MSIATHPVLVDEAAFRGQVVGPSDAAYHEHRKLWNGSFDKHPAVIVRCAGVSDVIAGVKFGRESGLPVAVRSGGHSFPGLSVADDAVVIDLSLMKGVRVDPDKRTARVQAGVLLGDLDRETQAFGLAVPSGNRHAHRGGRTDARRRDRLDHAQARTVDRPARLGRSRHGRRRVRQGEREENADLFWGVRGGGGNFGIVTEFEFRCVPLGPQVLAGPVFWPMEKSPEVLRFYRDWVADAPDDLMTIVVNRKAPPLPFVPQELHGKPVVIVVCCWAGDIEDGETVIRPLKEFGSPVVDLCVPKPYLTHQAMFDPSFPHGRWYYFKSCDVAELNDEIIDITVERSLQISSPFTRFPIWQMGGAVGRVGDDETAFNGRTAGFTYNIGASTETSEGFDEEREWVRGFWSALEPWHEGVYVNFLGEEGAERVRQAYGPKKYDRLQALKRKYDPDNFFRLNQNISPS